jgi:hypothetical protein
MSQYVLDLVYQWSMPYFSMGVSNYEAANVPVEVIRPRLVQRLLRVKAASYDENYAHAVVL